MPTKYRILLAVMCVVMAGFSINKSQQLYRFPVPAFFPAMPQALQNPVTVGGVELGRFLFYDPILSKDSSLSCASCHHQEAAFSDATNQFSIGSNSNFQKRNTPPLFNLAWHKDYFWDGRVSTIEEQVFHPVREPGELNLPWLAVAERINRSIFYRTKFRAVFGDNVIDSVLIGRAIAQFERTFISYRSKYDRVLNLKDIFTKDEAAGFEIVNNMTKGDCLHCHTTDADATGSTYEYSNNGLDSIRNANNYADAGRGGFTKQIYDNGKFKIPSLRNVFLTAPYMHDGRFKTLIQVLDFYSESVNMCANIDSKMEFAHAKGAHLSATEKKQILAFLKTLTDSAFVTDPAFANPFTPKRNDKEK